MDSLPDISQLNLNGEARVHSDRDMEKFRNHVKLLPYSVEPLSEMTEYLDCIILRLTQCVEAKDFDVGFSIWSDLLSSYVAGSRHPSPYP